MIAKNRREGGDETKERGCEAKKKKKRQNHPFEVKILKECHHQGEN